MKKTIIFSTCIFTLTCICNIRATNYDSRFISEEQYLNGPNYYTDDYQYELANDDLIRSMQLFSSSDDEQPEQKTIAITPRTQETNYYCGPASAQIVLKYDTGNLYEQSTLANYMQTSTNGTYVYQLSNGLNHYSNKTYNYRLSPTYSIFSNLYYNINHYKLMILNMDMTYVDNTYSSHTGHYVVACGYYKSATGTPQTCKIYYYDPFGTHAGYHWATEEKVVSGTAHNNGFFIC